ncbi:division/outer membrane stress-associated lipid-binding lipoprotein [Serratia microhaemolytica]|uniref:division/outer membrane stress-associated lipid-binding lipoprotein n=1 Tax=Serratia microhaemolytica TaxID=2675110 RepID=UPI000FDE3C2C|nr:division/outer membrane stress-associated lipid-binding lipoprotein [Serratia microhaemolytica]
MKLKASLAILAGSLLLQGCVAGLVAGGAAVVAKTATDPRTMGRQIDDSTLEARVATALARDLQLKEQARVITTAYQSNVLLTGQAPSSALIQRASEISKAVEGVAEVHNELRLGTPVTFSTASSDAWITAKVRSQLLTTENVQSTNIKVITENGEVFLLGLVTEKEGQTAAQVASQVSGVRRVTKAFVYLK